MYRLDKMYKGYIKVLLHGAILNATLFVARKIDIYRGNQFVEQCCRNLKSVQSSAIRCRNDVALKSSADAMLHVSIFCANNVALQIVTSPLDHATTELSVRFCQFLKG